MFNGIFDPAFLQAAGNVNGDAPENNIIRLHIFSQVLSFNPLVSCIGDISVDYVKNGEHITLHYSDLDNDDIVDDLPDEDTDVVITGKVTKLEMTGPPYSCINSVDVSECKTLVDLTASFGNLATLNLNTQLTNIVLTNSHSLEAIYYAAVNSAVTTAIANAITNADSNNGIIYTNSGAAYYDIIAQAATAKGWTIQEL